jgi:hypothetical protein
MNPVWADRPSPQDRYGCILHAMIHENLEASIAALEARMKSIRDSL